MGGRIRVVSPGQEAVQEDRGVVREDRAAVREDWVAVQEDLLAVREDRVAVQEDQLAVQEDPGVRTFSIVGFKSGPWLCATVCQEAGGGVPAPVGDWRHCCGLG